MRIIKLLLLLVLVGVVALGGVYVAENRGLVQAGTFTKVTTPLLGLSKNVPTQLNVAGVQNSVKTLTANTPIGEHTGAILGSSIEVKKQEAPLPQKAFELARYNYCQAVVNDYKARNETPETE